MRQITYSLFKFLSQFKHRNPRYLLSMFLFCLLISFRYYSRKRPTKSLKNRVVLVTGGVSGIGRLVALICKLKGSIVIVWDINENGLREMAEIVECCMKVNVASNANVRNAAKQVLDKFGHIDVLINNAGIANGKPLLDLTETDVQKCFNVNVLSHFWTVKSFLPRMIERKNGHIVTIASAAAVQGVSRLTDYSASKAAVRNFHDTLRMELIEQGIDEGISLSCICPYFVQTQLFDGTVPTKWWLAKKCGFDFLEPEYVANEIVRAIEYNEREVFLPDIVRISWLLGQTVVPNWSADYLIARSGCCIQTNGQMKRARTENNVK